MHESNRKTLDLHGESVDIAKILVQEFIEDCWKMGEEQVAIIHGIGSGKVKMAVHETLKKLRQVDHFYVNFWNIGETIVNLKQNMKF